jgi:hypothetical protein
MKPAVKSFMGKHLSDTFPIQNCLEKGDSLSPLLSNFALEYAIRKVHDDRVGLKLHETHRLLIYADDVNLFGDEIHTIQKYTEALIDATKEVGPEVNTEKTLYMLISHHQNGGQNHNKKIAYRSSENVAEFKYLE